MSSVNMPDSSRPMSMTHHTPSSPSARTRENSAEDAGRYGYVDAAVTLSPIGTSKYRLSRIDKDANCTRSPIFRYPVPSRNEPFATILPSVAGFQTSFSTGRGYSVSNACVTTGVSHTGSGARPSYSKEKPSCPVTLSTLPLL